MEKASLALRLSWPSASNDAVRIVTEAAIKQHLQNLYYKFAIPTDGERRVRLANEAIRRGAVTIAMLRDGGTSEG